MNIYCLVLGTRDQISSLVDKNLTLLLWEGGEVLSALKDHREHYVA